MSVEMATRNTTSNTVDFVDETKFEVLKETATQLDHRLIALNRNQDHQSCTNRISTAKYNALTFLPKFLFEQFRRYANIFFLVISILQQIPNVSPTGKYTTLIPLVIILTVSAIKEIFEDYKRHRADDATNNSMVLVLREDQWVDTQWKRVAVGDLVKVSDRQGIPADLVLLSSSEPQGMCYIETSNLDGETNLKLRQALPQTSGLLTVAGLTGLTGMVECELPHRHLYEFVGTIRLGPIAESQGYPLKTDQLMLRGASLRNTKWIFGLVVYTGRETKVMLNSTAPPLKQSTVDRQTDKKIIFLFVLLVVLALTCFIGNIVWTIQNGERVWYIKDPFDIKEKGGRSVLDFLTFLILYNTIIPISLPVTLELVRTIQTLFINWDIHMYDKESDTPALARTSNLNEELGQVSYIFSDKTGTLTRNVMEFKRCSIGGVLYGSDDLNAMSDPRLSNEIEKQNPDVDAFLSLLAVCHTVIPEYQQSEEPAAGNQCALPSLVSVGEGASASASRNTAAIVYQAASPDEGALVSAARNLGFALTTRTPEGVTVQVRGQSKKYTVLNVLDFTSARKRMSVIVRDPSNRILVMVKGADTVIYERLSPEASHKDNTMAHLDEFARSGLRTLCLAMSELNPDRYEEWLRAHYEASTAIQDREAKLERVAEQIEVNLELLGATAIEDKLQEGVPEAIANLAQANIKIWVLTGDKRETAINIGYSCKLLTEAFTLFTLNGTDVQMMETELNQALGILDLPPMDSLTSPGNNSGQQQEGDSLSAALVVDGQSLNFALSKTCQEQFLTLALACKAVICCRVSPLQKAEIVQLVRRNVRNAVTLAIGDGANDVGMIQAAHVGVGISGKEGLQAACSSDYAIAQFRFLNRLLLVHGAWNYHRLTKLILYCFYKNVFVFLIQFWFNIFNGFSGQTVFEEWTIALYNVMFTAAPPFVLGLFDRMCSADSCLRYPELYLDTQGSTPFTNKVFFYWLMNGILHSIAVFLMVYGVTYTDVINSGGQVGSLFFMGSTLYTCVVVSVCLKAGLEHRAWTVFSHLAIWGSILLWFLFLVVYSRLFPVLPFGSQMAGMDRALFSSGVYWFTVLLIPVVILTWDFSFKVFKRTMDNNLRDQVMQLEQQNMEPGSFIKSFVNAKSWRRIFRRGLRLPPHKSDVVSSNHPDHGFAFSQTEGSAVRQSEVIRSYDSTRRKPVGF